MDTQVRYSLESAIEQDRQSATAEEEAEAAQQSKGFRLDAYQIQVIIAIALVLSVFMGVVSS